MTIFSIPLSSGINSNTHQIMNCFDLQTIIHRQILSTGISKVYIPNTNCSFLQPLAAAYYFKLHKNPNRSSIFSLFLSNFKILNYLALVSLPCSMFACPPYCYYRSTKLRHRRVSKILRSTFLFLFYNPNATVT